MKLRNLLLLTILVLFISSVLVMAENEGVDGKDLDIMSYSVMPKPVVMGEPVEVTLKFENQGDEDITKSFQVEFQVCQPGGSYCHIADGVEINGLVAGESIELLREFDIKGSDVVNNQSLIRLIVDGDGEISETNEVNNLATMVISTTTEIIEEDVSGNPVTFTVSVNDYPAHKSYELSKTVSNAYVNMYTVKLVEDGFKVVDTETKFTGSKGTAKFTIQPGQMVYFEGFLTMNGAKQGKENKEALFWTAPPYKNFGEGKVCQTHWQQTDEYLKYSEDYACAASLSVPFNDVGKITLVEEETADITEELTEEEEEEEIEYDPEELESDTDYNDLKVTAVGYGNDGFEATICNAGTNDLSGFKVRFTANDKDNVLTYAATSSAGNCLTLSSWSYSYFDVSVEDSPEITVTVDPYNEFAELDEGNNEKSNEEEIMLPAYDETKQVTEEDENMLPAYDETKQAKKAVNCPNGCSYEEKCLPVGTKIKTAQPLFCDWDGEMKEQLPEGKFCQNNYECESNSCMSGKCLDLEKKLQEQQNLLEKIVSWLGKMFG